MEYIGWVGSFLAMSASLLLSSGFLKKENLVFSVPMFLASVIFMYSSYRIDNIQGVFSNALFVASSLLAVFGVMLNFKFISMRNVLILSGTLFVATSAYYLNSGVSGWFFQSIGWIPVVTLPCVFLLFTQRKIKERAYFNCNLATHVLFFTHLVYVGNYPLASLQVVSFMIALVGISRLSFFKTKATNEMPTLLGIFYFYTLVIKIII